MYSYGVVLIYSKSQGLTSASVNARMTASIISSGSLNKVLMELSRQCKEKLGIKWNNLTNTDNLHD